jgi:hypothetical protein
MASTRQVFWVSGVGPMSQRSELAALFRRAFTEFNCWHAVFMHTRMPLGMNYQT